MVICFFIIVYRRHLWVFFSIFFFSYFYVELLTGKDVILSCKETPAETPPRGYRVCHDGVKLISNP